MNKKIIIASALTAAAAGLLILARRKKQRSELQLDLPVHQSRHLTEVFAKAKSS